MSVVSFQHRPREGLNTQPLRVAGCSSPSRQGFGDEGAAGQNSPETPTQHSPHRHSHQDRDWRLEDHGTQSRAFSSAEKLEFIE